MKCEICQGDATDQYNGYPLCYMHLRECIVAKYIFLDLAEALGMDTKGLDKNGADDEKRQLKNEGPFG